jgi:hypothetical protein
LYNQGCGEMLAGDTTAARAAFRRCLELNPQDDDARWNLELLDRLVPEPPPESPPAPDENRDQAEQLLDSVRDREQTYLPPRPEVSASSGGPYW